MSVKVFLVDDSAVARQALAAGAVAVLAMPKLGVKQFFDDSRRAVIQTLKTAAKSRPCVRRGPRRSR